MVVSLVMETAAEVNLKRVGLIRLSAAEAVVAAYSEYRRFYENHITPFGTMINLAKRTSTNYTGV